MSAVFLQVVKTVSHTTSNDNARNRITISCCAPFVASFCFDWLGKCRCRAEILEFKAWGRTLTFVLGSRNSPERSGLTVCRVAAIA